MYARGQARLFRFVAKFFIFDIVLTLIIGISAMITGSIYFPLYYIFHCEPTLFLFYISIISLLGGYSIYFCWYVALVRSDECNINRIRRSHNVGDAGFEGVRVALFVGLSFFGTFPLVHGYVSYFVQ
jgi:hypothetical protein